MELTKYIQIFKRKKWLIVIITAIAIMASSIFSIFMIDPTYESAATMIIGRSSNAQSEKTQYNDILMYEKLVKTYAELAKSRSVNEEAVKALGYNIKFKNLQGMVSVTPKGDTQILEISVRSKDAQVAYRLADMISKTFMDKVDSLMESGDVKILDEARLPEEPVSPNIFLNVVIAAVTGLAGSLLIALILEYIDNTIKSENDIERILEIPILASVPYVPFKNNGRPKSSKIITLKEPKSPVSEIYKTLATNLKFMSFQKDVKTIVVTSPGPGEGKSTTTANLGVTLAYSGNKVLILDGDLRNPSLHKYFSMSNDRGLTNILLDSTPYRACLSDTHVDNLDVITCGPKPPNPAEILVSQKMSRMLGILKESYDYILIDAPPVVVISDAALLASICDSTLLVIAYGQTIKDGAVKAKQLLKTANAGIIGAILNKVQTDSVEGYHKYYNSYYDNNKTNKLKKLTFFKRRKNNV